jgi:hypothetical protein
MANWLKILDTGDHDPLHKYYCCIVRTRSGTDAIASLGFNPISGYSRAGTAISNMINRTIYNIRPKIGV